LEGKDINDNTESPLMRFLDILIDRDKEKLIAENISHAILTRSIRFGNIMVKTEKSINEFGIITKGGDDRIDIFIEAELKENIPTEIKKIAIVIENKVGSSENAPKGSKETDPLLMRIYNSSYQTWRYFLGTIKNVGEEAKNVVNKLEETSEDSSDILNDKVNIQPLVQDQTYYIFVFLTPISNYDLKFDLGVRPKCKYYIHINYQDIADHIIEPLLNAENQQSRIAQFLKEYLFSLLIPGELEKGNDERDASDNKKDAKKGTQKQYIIMASSEDDRNTANHFYNNYKDLIEECINASENSSKPENKLLCSFKNNYKNIIMTTLNVLLDEAESDRENLVELYSKLGGVRQGQRYKITFPKGFSDKPIIANGHNDLVRAVVKHYAQDHSSEEVMKAFNIKGNFNYNGTVYDYDFTHKVNTIQAVVLTDAILKKYKKDPRFSYTKSNGKKELKRFSTDVIICKNNDKVYCNTQWNPGPKSTNHNIPAFIDIAKKLGYEITKL
jgi:hypothetical protein